MKDTAPLGLFRLYFRILALLGSESRLAWTLALANVALAAALFTEPVLLGRIIDTLSNAQARGAPPSWPRLVVLLGTWVAFGLFTIICGTLIALFADRLAHRRRQHVLTNYFEHVLQLPLTYHGNIHSGRLMKVMLQGTDSIWGLWLGFFRDHFSSVVSLGVLLPFSLYVNWRLASLLIALCVIFLALTALIVRKTHTMQSAVERHYTDLAQRAADTLGNIALVQSFSRLESEVIEMRRIVGAGIDHRHAAAADDVGAGLIIGRLEQTVSFSNRIVSEAPRLREFFQVWDTVPDIRDKPEAIDPGRVEGLVEFKDVSFSYDANSFAGANLKFKALPGEMIALVGPTGSGKSTAIALLHRAFDPQSGVIEIDGVDIRDYKLSALRRNIGVVFQESLLFDRTIAENLRIGNPDATDADLRDAADRAQALGFIERKFHGFDGRVGERGRSLSGGERQRLSIARALLKDPPILILDEATSALDADTEAKLMKALDEVMKNRTTFVIAHRLATVRRASKILVFEGGRIVETGTFEELVEAGGRFASLAQAQLISVASSDAPEMARGEIRNS